MLDKSEDGLKRNVKNWTIIMECTIQADIQCDPNI